MQLDWNTGLVKHLGIRFVETDTPHGEIARRGPPEAPAADRRHVHVNQ